MLASIVYGLGMAVLFFWWWLEAKNVANKLDQNMPLTWTDILGLDLTTLAYLGVAEYVVILYLVR